MTRLALRFAATTASVALGVVLASASASAAVATYAQHIHDCAQSMGFDQNHNPGAHRGISMWDLAHTC